MPVYRVTSPDGRVLRFTGDSPPDENVMIEAFDMAKYRGRTRLGGSEAVLSPGEPESLLAKLSRKKSEFLHGEDSAGRAGARAAGIGLQPTPAEMARVALAGAAAAGGPASLAVGPAVVGALGRPGGAVLKFAMTPVGSAAIGAAEGARRGPMEAITGAATGAGYGLAGRGLNVLRLMARFKGAQGVAAKEALAAAQTAKAATAGVPAAVGSKAGGAVASEGQDMAANITRWRNEHKFSNGQIVNALRQVYGIARPQAKEILKLLGD